jgi:hypothetical protein
MTSHFHRFDHQYSNTAQGARMSKDIHKNINGVASFLFFFGLLAITAGWMWAVSDLDWWRILLNVGFALLGWSGLISYVNAKSRGQR